MRIVLAVFVGVLLLVGAAGIYLKFTGPNTASTSAPQITQKAKDLPDPHPASPSESQNLGVTFREVQPVKGEYSVTVDTVNYADIAETTQVTTITVNGHIEDKVHPIKFWQAASRFRLLNNLGAPFASKTIVKPATTGLTFTSVFSKVPVQALRNKEVYLAIQPEPSPGISSQPLVLSITPDRFRSGR